MISRAIFLSILKLQAITPPNALVGSQEYAFLKDCIGLLFSDTPHGFACLIITDPALLLIDLKISKEANISL